MKIIQIRGKLSVEFTTIQSFFEKKVIKNVKMINFLFLVTAHGFTGANEVTVSKSVIYSSNCWPELVVIQVRNRKSGTFS